MDDYNDRLNSLPEVDKEVEAQIKKYEELVEDQSTFTHNSRKLDQSAGR